MTKLWFCLSPMTDKRKIARWYKRQSGNKFVPPEQGQRAVECEPKIESLEEIDKLMRQKPSGMVK